MLCALCSAPFPVYAIATRTSSFSLCCGKRFCWDCSLARNAAVGKGQSERCLFCNSPLSRRDKEKIGSLKKHAKKGAAWAQFVLGAWFENGSDSLSKSDHDAKRWYEKAAKQGHPEATYALATFFLKGIGGCTVNLSKARELAEKAMSLDRHVADLSR